MGNPVVGERIRMRRKELGMTLDDIAGEIGVAKSTIQRYETGTIEKLKLPVIEAIARVLRVAPEWLAGKSDNMLRNETPTRSATIPPGFQPLPEMSVVPIIGRIACGQPITAEENVEGTTSLPSEWGADFILICQGSSMSPKILDGDAVAIRKVEEVYNGQISAVRIDNEATLKKVYRYPDRLELRPINPDFDSIVLYGEEMNAAAIEGKAVGLCRGI